MHPSVAQALETIDAAVFNGDTFEDEDARAELLEYLEAWTLELGLVVSDHDEESEDA